MFIPSAISKPDIITSVGKDESRSLAFLIDDPCLRAIDKSMLKNDGFESFFDGASFPLDAVHGEDVSIFSDDLMRLNRIIKVFAVFNDWKFSFRMCGRDEKDEKC